MGSKVILSFSPRKENSPHSGGLTLTQSWPLTLISTLGTCNIHQLSPYRITADTDKPHSNKHQKTPMSWRELKKQHTCEHFYPVFLLIILVASIKRYLSSIFVTPGCWFFTYLESLADLFSVRACVCPTMLWDLQPFVPFALSLQHHQYGGQNWQVPHTHTQIHGPKTAVSQNSSGKRIHVKANGPHGPFHDGLRKGLNNVLKVP